MHLRIVAEREEDGSDRADERRVIATRQVRAANRAGEERVAHEQLLPFLTRFAHLKTDAARTMPRRVIRPRLVLAEGDRLAGRVEDIDRRRLFDLESEQRTRLDGAV